MKTAAIAANDVESLYAVFSIRKGELRAIGRETQRYEIRRRGELDAIVSVHIGEPELLIPATHELYIRHAATIVGKHRLRGALRD
jgi:hypothetical protein